MLSLRKNSTGSGSQVTFFHIYIHLMMGYGLTSCFILSCPSLAASVSLLQLVFMGTNHICPPKKFVKCALVESAVLRFISTPIWHSIIPILITKFAHAIFLSSCMPPIVSGEKFNCLIYSVWQSQMHFYNREGPWFTHLKTAQVPFSGWHQCLYVDSV